MAFWQRKGSKVVVFYWDSEAKKQKAIPRAITQHLNCEEDSAIERWVAKWEALHSAQQAKPLKVYPGNPFRPYFDRFYDFLRAQGRHPTTVSLHKQNLEAYAFAYFFNTLALSTFKDLGSHSKGLMDWLRDKQGVRLERIRKVNVSLTMFWRWLTEEGYVHEPLLLRKPLIPGQGALLKFTVTPEQMLAWKPKRADLELMGLLGYFFSLRPQEIQALRPCDFIAGGKTADLEASLVMNANGLCARLVVNVHRQVSKGIVGHVPCKAYSQGVVACFDERAARRVVALLNEHKPTEKLFQLQIHGYLHAWRRGGYPGITLKDLRRASLYWLGHYTTLDLLALKNHARHRNVETTSLYTRRPLEDVSELGVLGDLSLD